MMLLDLGEHDIAVVLRFDDDGMMEESEAILSASRNKSADLMCEMLIEALNGEEYTPFWKLALKRVKERGHDPS